jgi:hypothetical protein
MKVAVVGSRTFIDYDILKKNLDIIHEKKPITYIVSGGAKGADSLGEKWAKENNIESLIFIPDWDKFGKSAGYKRNESIIINSDIVIAFWDGKSKGTQHSINLSKQHNKPVFIVKF